jgi:hypothetical protein
MLNSVLFITCFQTECQPLAIVNFFCNSNVQMYNSLCEFETKKRSRLVTCLSDCCHSFFVVIQMNRWMNSLCEFETKKEVDLLLGKAIVAQKKLEMKISWDCLILRPEQEITSDPFSCYPLLSTVKNKAIKACLPTAMRLSVHNSGR